MFVLTGKQENDNLFFSWKLSDKRKFPNLNLDKYNLMADWLWCIWSCQCNAVNMVFQTKDSQVTQMKKNWQLWSQISVLYTSNRRFLKSRFDCIWRFIACSRILLFKWMLCVVIIHVIELIPYNGVNNPMSNKSFKK